jgi:hypothetical protein
MKIVKSEELSLKQPLGTGTLRQKAGRLGPPLLRPLKRLVGYVIRLEFCAQPSSRSEKRLTGARTTKP